MTINPYILLGIGSFFALLYAAVIIIGWAATCRNRKVIFSGDTVMLPTIILDPTLKNAPGRAKALSLKSNTYLGTDGTEIDFNALTPYVAIGHSTEHPNIKQGNLILVDSEGKWQAVINTPSLINYR